MQSINYLNLVQQDKCKLHASYSSEVSRVMINGSQDMLEWGNGLRFLHEIDDDGHAVIYDKGHTDLASNIQKVLLSSTLVQSKRS